MAFRTPVTGDNQISETVIKTAIADVEKINLNMFFLLTRESCLRYKCDSEHGEVNIARNI